jgi:hypothetical protein
MVALSSPCCLSSLPSGRRVAHSRSPAARSPPCSRAPAPPSSARATSAQVAIYGKDFKTAAKDTLQLVRSKGLDGLVNQNLTRQAVGLGTLVGMVLSGAIVAIVSYAPLLGSPLSRAGLSEDVKTVYQSAYTIVIVISAILGALFAGMISTTINSGVTTLFVCWAEQPAELLDSNPELHRKFDELTNTYLREQAVMNPQNTYSHGV